MPSRPVSRACEVNCIACGPRLLPTLYGDIYRRRAYLHPAKTCLVSGLHLVSPNLCVRTRPLVDAVSYWCESGFCLRSEQEKPGAVTWMQHWSALQMTPECWRIATIFQVSFSVAL